MAPLFDGSSWNLVASVQVFPTTHLSGLLNTLTQLANKPALIQGIAEFNDEPEGGGDGVALNTTAHNDPTTLNAYIATWIEALGKSPTVWATSGSKGG